MRENLKIYIFLLFIYLFLASAGILVIQLTDIPLLLKEVSILLTGALIFSFIATTIFLKGVSLGKSKGVVATLIAIAVKFLLYIALIGIYALIFKELTITFLVTYFLIYLTFNTYLLITFVGILKTKNEFKQYAKGDHA